jgi:hypothetical protein
LGPRQSSVAVTFFMTVSGERLSDPKCESSPGIATWRSETKAMQYSLTTPIY